jgi:hypothetical protein
MAAQAAIQITDRSFAQHQYVQIIGDHDEPHGKHNGLPQPAGFCLNLTAIPTTLTFSRMAHWCHSLEDIADESGARK